MRVDDDAVLVITDKEYGATFTVPNVRVGERVVILTVRDDATHEQRLAMAEKAAEIVRARTGAS